MDKDLIESYKQKMLEMYNQRVKSANTVTSVALNQTPAPSDNTTATGRLLGVATQIRGLYFVPNTKVTVFTGSPDNMQIIDTDYTDQNGKTKEFILSTPLKSESQTPNDEIPYTLYNMMFEAEGYLTNIHLNIPVFPDVTSRQISNLLLLETSGVDKGPRIFDEFQNYNL